VHAGELRKQGVRIKLQDQPFQILAMLVEHPGKVVTRDELRKLPDRLFGKQASFQSLKKAIAGAATPILVHSYMGNSGRKRSRVGSRCWHYSP
jgi:DNA-binding response OmpR family regulator